MDMKKVEDLRLMPFFQKMAKASESELHDIRYDINKDIKNINDVINTLSNNGRGWIDDKTNARAMDNCNEAGKELPRLYVMLDMVEHFLRNK